MHFKRTAALLKIVNRANGKMEKIIEEIVSDISRNPNKYSMKEKIMVYDYVSKFRFRALGSIAASIDTGKGLAKLYPPKKNS